MMQKHSLGMSAGKEHSNDQLILFYQDLFTFLSPTVIFPKWVHPGQGVLGMSSREGLTFPRELLEMPPGW